MAVISSVLAIIGLIILTVIVFALIGAGSTASALGLGDGLASLLTWFGSIIASFWEIFAVIFTVGLIAYVARGGRGRGLGFERAVGAAQGAARGMRDDSGGDRASTDPSDTTTPDTDTSPEPEDSTTDTTSPTGPDSDSSGGGADVDLDVSQLQQQQQQMMQQLIQAIVMGNMSQNPSGTYIMQQQQQQQMMGAGLFSGISPSIYRTFINNIDNYNNQQIVNQFLQFIQANDIDQVNDQVLAQFMKQVLNINVDIDTGGGDGDVIVQINQIIQHIDITMIEQNIEKIVSEINITNNQFIFVEQLIAILFSLEEGDYTKEGDTIIIDTTGLSIDVNITVEIQASVLINFLTIMKVIKYWELKELITALVEMPQNNPWSAKIEQLIVIYRELNGRDTQGPNIDLTGSNWEVFLRTIEKIDFEESLKRQTLSILREERDIRNLDLSIAEVANLRDCIKGMPKKDVPEAGQEFIQSIVSNNGLNSQSIENFLDYLLSKWPVNRDYLKNENHYKNMATPNIVDGTEERLQEIIGQIEDQEQVERHVVELDEDAVKNLKHAINAFEREKGFIHAVRQISTDLDDNSIGNIGQQIREINQEMGENLFDEENARQHIQDLENMSQDFEQAIEDLKEADHEMEQIEQSDIQMEEALQEVEQKELQMTKAARTVLQQIHN